MPQNILEEFAGEIAKRRMNRQRKLDLEDKHAELQKNNEEAREKSLRANFDTALFPAESFDSWPVASFSSDEDPYLCDPAPRREQGDQLPYSAHLKDLSTKKMSPKKEFTPIFAATAAVPSSWNRGQTFVEVLNRPAPGQRPAKSDSANHISLDIDMLDEQLTKTTTRKGKKKEFLIFSTSSRSGHEN